MCGVHVWELATPMYISVGSQTIFSICPQNMARKFSHPTHLVLLLQMLVLLLQRLLLLLQLLVLLGLVCVLCLQQAVLVL